MYVVENNIQQMEQSRHAFPAFQNGKEKANKASPMCIC